MPKTCGDCHDVKPLTDFANKGKHTYCRDCMRKRNRKAKYSLDTPNLLALLSSQQHKCAICEITLTESTCHVDHDHNTGLIRGLLCRACNTGLGLYGDSTDRLSRAISYLERPPLNILSVTMNVQVEVPS